LTFDMYNLTVLIFRQLLWRWKAKTRNKGVWLWRYILHANYWRFNGYSFIHSGYFYSASSSPLLFRGAPDTARLLCRSFHAEASQATV